MDSQIDSGHLISTTPFPQQWHVTNISGDATIYGYIWSTFTSGFADVKFLWDFLGIDLAILHDAP